jgi:DNA recombination protein RmuC
MSPDLLLALLAGLGVANLVAVVLLLRRLPRRRDEAADEAARLAARQSEQALREELRALREESSRAARDLREEVGGGLRGASELLVRTVGELGGGQRAQLLEVSRQLEGLAERSQLSLDAVRGTLDARLLALSEGIHGRLEATRETVDTRLAQLSERNEAKLEEMRRTVDEQLQGTLEKRLGESLQLVSGNLEAVYRGLGEMRALAAGVGDLKRVLTNVKTRGTWAEVQLGALLEQILTPDQFARNVRVKAGSEERVEYAVRLPGRGGSAATAVWLPIDSKFPQETYLRLIEASEAADPVGVQAAVAELARTVRLCARTIQEKYVAPPETTDFAVLFLPTEGLYAEVLRQAGLVEQLQQSWRVVVAGPTTLAALLSSLRMGFKTLAIEQRASEVWHVLGAVKTEFGKFGDVLERVKRQLATATRTLTETGVRTRAMERKLREVEELPAEESAQLLKLPDGYVQLDLLDEEPAGDETVETVEPPEPSEPAE